ncbi:UvrD-helicase domain-containing protein [Chitinivibrio alkaliphilus]|uniref:DNA 3'-5' helicase n=1 Tax=Chitinivibrio alkaliphilus ACht1 TaxID=1313304 RepID=U7D8E3_9BACT|nr:UvrD-helicase domain-containing protein [Chitinivibrio alkaliphilus]ERP30700.1 Exonuclease V subunit beta [Chitinivibrio alkaliphilus ACht1]
MNKFSIQDSFAISAGAGTGKTYTLSRRYINALLGFDFFRESMDQPQYIQHYADKAADVHEIVTITYTEAAALEMKERIFGLIKKVATFRDLDRTDNDYNSIAEGYKDLSPELCAYVENRLSKELTKSNSALISTIHSFCLGIIRKNCDIARIDSSLEMIKDEEKEVEIDAIVFSVINSGDNHDRVLSLSRDVSMYFFKNLIDTYLGSAKFRLNFRGFEEKADDMEFYKSLIRDIYPLPDIEDALKELAEKGKEVHSYWLKQFYHACAAFESDTFSEKAPTFGEKTYPVADPVKKNLEKVRKQYASISKEPDFRKQLQNTSKILVEIKQEYDDRLSELGKIDFDTIIDKTAEILPRLNTAFRYVMVDEFQDTNATQFEIVKGVCSEKTNLFVVGDAKQSIYSFQGAELMVFNEAIWDRKLFSSVQPMSVNHRSDGVVLDTVNRIFERLLVPCRGFATIKRNFEATAQKLDVFKKERQKTGSFEFLITPKENKGEENEYATVAHLIRNISDGSNGNYNHIKELIDRKEQAIAVLFDAKTQMLKLKAELNALGIECRVSASENFYHTKEVMELFLMLKAILIVNSQKSEYGKVDRYYLSGAYRSSYLRMSDTEVVQAITAQKVPGALQEFAVFAEEHTLSELVTHIVRHSRIADVYSRIEGTPQRMANLQKFITLVMEFEQAEGDSLYRLIQLFEHSVFFSHATEDEAFYKSDSVESIELCSIHHTKGLSYPMIILANSEKKLMSQVNSEAIKHNSFYHTERGLTELIGFKVSGYEPLSFRILKGLDQLKHNAEKKRLLYVALTRARHDVVISGTLAKKKDGSICSIKDSYLEMISDSLNMDLPALFRSGGTIPLHPIGDSGRATAPSEVSHEMPPIKFTEPSRVSATAESKAFGDGDAARRGTIVHKCIELHWNSLVKGEYETIFSKEMVADKDRGHISRSLDAFLESDMYQKLKNGVEHYFELPFDDGVKNGFIDLVYFDVVRGGWHIVDIKTGKQSEDKMEKYQKQLDFYTDFFQEKGVKVVGAELLWV